jgi:uncharacterized protein YjeT (DUF2065 family)
MAIDKLSGLFLIVLGVLVICNIFVLPFGSPYRPGPSFFPVILGGVAIITGIGLFLTGGNSKKLSEIEWKISKHVLCILGGCFFAAVFIDYLGYRITMMVLLSFFFLYLEKMRKSLAVALTVALSLGSYVLFVNGLKLYLPVGPWGF